MQNSKMVYGKIRGKLFVFVTCIILIECRSFLHLSETQETKDGGSEIIPEQFKPDHEGFYEYGGFDEAGFEDLDDDASVAAQQKKMRIQGQLVSSSETALGAISPKLRCGDNLMKLQLNGPEVAHIELSRDNGAPVSLTKLPPHCGETTPTDGGLVYATPYDGCGVMQQGGSYVIRIQWKGNSAVISCPMLSSTTANKSFLGPSPPTYVHILPYHSPPDAEDPMPEPSTSEAGEESTLSQEMPKPQPPGHPQAFPQTFWPYHYPHYHYPGMVYPIAKPTGLPTKPTVVQALTQKPQLPEYPQGFRPNYYPYYHHGSPKPMEKPVPTSMPTTTSVAQSPTQKPPHPGYPLDSRPYYDPHGKPNSPTNPNPAIPTASPSSLPATTQKPQHLLYLGKRFPQYEAYPNYALYLQQLYSQNPGQPPNMPPIATPQLSKAATGRGLSGIQPPNEPPQYHMLYEKDPFAIHFVDFDPFL